MAKKRTPPKKAAGRAAGGLPLPPSRHPADVSHSEFEVVLQLINEARSRTVSYANTTLIDLYWSIGEFISGRISTAAWGEGTVQALAEHIRRHRPNVRGFSAQNLWRMRQFYETYRDRPELSALLRELSWTNNMLILGKSKRPGEEHLAHQTVPLPTFRRERTLARVAGRSSGEVSPRLAWSMPT